MSNGVTVKIFLSDGTADGLKIVERSNWTGIAVMCSRAQYPDAQHRSEFDGPGVYVLIGPSASGNQPAVYVGEADIARSRLNQHVKNTDFWTSLILFTSKDANLNKAHVRYLESRLVSIARAAKRAQLQNGNVPGTPQLSESDRADMESFLRDMLVIYPLLGVTAFEVVSAVRTDDSEKLYLKGKDAAATGRETSEGFVVYAGSTARIGETPTLHNYVRALRRDLFDSGVFESREGRFHLTQDYRFDSPSTAAMTMLGRVANGRREWKDNSGRTLKEIQSIAVGSATELPASEAEEG